MGDTYEFWTHGVNVQVEYTDASRGLDIRRAGFGTRIRQTKGTSNWFHLAIPTPTKLRGWGVRHYDAWLRVKVNNDAAIKKVHVRESSRVHFDECFTAYNSGDINITGQTTQLTFNLPDTGVEGPMVVCVYVEFEGDDGEILFVGAGAWFER